MNKQFQIGVRVRISEGAGLDSGKGGRIVEPRMDYRGFPLGVTGAYKPFDGRTECYIRLDDGSYTTMFHGYLIRLGQN